MGDISTSPCETSKSSDSASATMLVMVYDCDRTSVMPFYLTCDANHATFGTQIAGNRQQLDKEIQNLHKFVLSAADEVVPGRACTAE